MTVGSISRFVVLAVLLLTADLAAQRGGRSSGGGDARPAPRSSSPAPASRPSAPAPSRPSSAPTSRPSSAPSKPVSTPSRPGPGVNPARPNVGPTSNPVNPSRPSSGFDSGRGVRSPSYQPSRPTTPAPVGSPRPTVKPGGTTQSPGGVRDSSKPIPGGNYRPNDVGTGSKPGVRPYSAPRPYSDTGSSAGDTRIRPSDFGPRASTRYNPPADANSAKPQVRPGSSGAQPDARGVTRPDPKAGARPGVRGDGSAIPTKATGPATGKWPIGDHRYIPTTQPRPVTQPGVTASTNGLANVAKPQLNPRTTAGGLVTSSSYLGAYCGTNYYHHNHWNQCLTGYYDQCWSLCFNFGYGCSWWGSCYTPCNWWYPSYHCGYWYNNWCLPWSTWWCWSGWYAPSYYYVPVYTEVPVYVESAPEPVGEARPTVRELTPAEQAERLMNLGDFYFREGRYAEAAEAYGKARALLPEDASLHFLHADAVFATGDYHFAAFLIREGLRLDPEMARAETDKRKFYGDPKAFDTQLAVLQKYVVDKPYDAMAWLVLGYNLRFSKQPNAAKSAFERALTIDPGNEAAATFLAALAARTI